MRPIMTRDELKAHEIDQHGRDYSRSCDGYDDMEVAGGEGWHAIGGWGHDGWDLGDWPYVVVSVRAGHQMRVTVEGDTTVYSFETDEDRNAGIDYLFIWYGIVKEHSDWAEAGLGATWDQGACDYTTRQALDAGTLRVPERFRGPFSWARCNA